MLLSVWVFTDLRTALTRIPGANEISELPLIGSMKDQTSLSQSKVLPNHSLLAYI